MHLGLLIKVSRQLTKTETAEIPHKLLKNSKQKANERLKKEKEKARVAIPLQGKQKRSISRDILKR